MSVLRSERLPPLLLAVFATLGALPVVRSLIVADLNWCYPYMTADSYDWISNGLFWSGKPILPSLRPPGLPLVIAGLSKVGLLSLLPCRELPLSRSLDGFPLSPSARATRRVDRGGGLLVLLRERLRAGPREIRAGRDVRDPVPRPRGAGLRARGPGSPVVSRNGLRARRVVPVLLRRGPGRHRARARRRRGAGRGRQEPGALEGGARGRQVSPLVGSWFARGSTASTRTFHATTSSPCSGRPFPI